MSKRYRRSYRCCDRSRKKNLLCALEICPLLREKTTHIWNSTRQFAEAFFFLFSSLKFNLPSISLHKTMTFQKRRWSLNKSFENWTVDNYKPTIHNTKAFVVKLDSKINVFIFQENCPLYRKPPADAMFLVWKKKKAGVLHLIFQKKQHVLF